MASSVLKIKYTIPLKRLRKKLKESGNPEGVGFIHVGHGPDTPPKSSLIGMARRDKVARGCVVELARLGYYIYSGREKSSRLVRSDLLRELWGKLKNGDYRMNADEIVHSITMPVTGEAPKRLLVIFSSIHHSYNSPSPERYFMQNFGTIQKFLPKDTAVLRVADLGGVVGAFYINTTHRPNNANAIGKLIESVRMEFGLDPDSVTCYGTSKGGGGALYHGLRGGFRFVAVDPILSDKHYVEQMGDAHFTTGGIYPETKEVVFGRLFDQHAKLRVKDKSSTRHTVICSERSPQYSYINDAMIRRFGDSMAFFNSRNPLINDHPDVGAQTVNTATMLMNMQLYKLPILPGLFHID